MEHEERTERLEGEADKLERESDRVSHDIDEARREWEQKEQDSSVPGAQPDPEEDEENAAGIETEIGERDEPMGPGTGDEEDG